jgi:hypothetical protein
VVGGSPVRGNGIIVLWWTCGDYTKYCWNTISSYFTCVGREGCCVCMCVHACVWVCLRVPACVYLWNVCVNVCACAFMDACKPLPVCMRACMFNGCACVCMRNYVLLLSV